MSNIVEINKEESTADYDKHELYQALSFLSSVSGDYTSSSPRQKAYPLDKSRDEMMPLNFLWAHDGPVIEGQPYWWLTLTDGLDGVITVQIIEQFAPPAKMYTILGWCAYHNVTCEMDTNFYEGEAK